MTTQSIEYAATANDEEYVETEKDRQIYDALDLNDCFEKGCKFVSQANNLDLTCMATSIDKCPAVKFSHIDKTAALEYIAEQKGIVNETYKEYEVWCRESCEDSAVVMARSIEEAHQMASELVESGGLSTTQPVDLLFGARDIDAGDADLTLVCDKYGQTMVIHYKGSVEDAMAEAGAARYEVIAIFRGQHDDIYDY